MASKCQEPPTIRYLRVTIRRPVYLLIT